MVKRITGGRPASTPPARPVTGNSTRGPREDEGPIDGPADENTVVYGLLRDLASIQPTRQQEFGYKRAAEVVMGLEQPLRTMQSATGVLPRMPGIGPSSLKVIDEVLRTGGSPTAEAAIDASGKREDVERRRELREGFLSRAAALRILDAPAAAGVASRLSYRGDLQMHSSWSDGRVSIAEMAEACRARRYAYCAITDHAQGLPIARGLSPEAIVVQHREIDALNTKLKGFRVLKGIEANIAADGTIDVEEADRASFDLVLAAPHSKLRGPEDQTLRLVRAVLSPGVQILAHPRGRVAGTRAGVVANWDAVFAAAASRRVAIELDGDPSRQDLDAALARRALSHGCLFALDSDAHGPDELAYVDTAIAHARLAGLPASRIINCWPLSRLLAWAQRLRA